MSNHNVTLTPAAAIKKAARTHKPNSTYRIADPLDRLLRRAEGDVRSAASSIEYWSADADRLRKLARERAERGNRSGQQSANDLADSQQRKVDRLLVELALCQQELDFLNNLRNGVVKSA